MKNFPHNPKQSLGQNFLIDENIAKKIVLSLALNSEDYVFEIGAGKGILTKYIVSKVHHVLVVEIDKNLAQNLKTGFKNQSNFQLIEANFLNLELDDIFLGEQSWKVVGNIPYHITSSIIFKILNFRENVDSLTLMVQKEVAQRICAEPDSKTYGIPSVLSYLYADVKILFYVSKNVFSPKPKVDSAVVQWNFLSQPRYILEDEHFFTRMVKAVFGQRRKVIKNSLKAFGVNISGLNFQLTKRPEQLSVAELVQLSNLITHGKKRL